MDDTYPQDVLAREPAPPYAAEGAFALWHYSEDADLGRFQPRVAVTDPAAPPLVWAVDTRHAPMFWFPRDCPEAASGRRRLPHRQTASCSSATAPQSGST